jgi:hypothetical protein
VHQLVGLRRVPHETPEGDRLRRPFVVVTILIATRRAVVSAKVLTVTFIAHTGLPPAYLHTKLTLKKSYYV